MENKKESPCLTCTRVECPRECTAKDCPVWREWWLQKWEEIHRWWEKHNDK